MQRQPMLEKCLPFINSETRGLPKDSLRQPSESPPLTITISRQSGSGAHSVAQHLAKYLQARTTPTEPAWQIFDRRLVEQVLEDNNLPPRLARFMPEDRGPNLTHIMDELLGLHPPIWTLVQKTAETVIRLAYQGHCILIGRGAHLITRELEHVFHVRLVASLERRVQHMKELRAIDERQALALIRQEDRGRRRYVKQYFGRDLDDPLSYHLTINTDSVSYERAARMIADAALDHHQAQDKMRISVAKTGWREDAGREAG